MTINDSNASYAKVSTYIVDVDPEQEGILDSVVQQHPGLQLAGTGKAPPRWIVMGQHNVQRFTSETFP